jgi:hypothetical protein
MFTSAKAKSRPRPCFIAWSIRTIANGSSRRAFFNGRHYWLETELTQLHHPGLPAGIVADPNSRAPAPRCAGRPRLRDIVLAQGL